MPSFYKKLVWEAVFDFQDFQKGTFWTPFSATKAPTSPTVSWAGRPCRDPAFHENKIITVPFGPSVFEKVIFSIKIC